MGFLFAEGAAWRPHFLDSRRGRLRTQWQCRPWCDSRLYRDTLSPSMACLHLMRPGAPPSLIAGKTPVSPVFSAGVDVHGNPRKSGHVGTSWSRCTTFVHRTLSEGLHAALVDGAREYPAYSGHYPKACIFCGLKSSLPSGV